MPSRVARWVWSRTHQPKAVAVTMWAVYAVITLSGVAAIVYPPTTVQGAIGVLAMDMIGGMLIAGGVLGAVAVLPGIWWVERLAISIQCAGISVYLAVVAALHISTPGSRLLQAGLLVATVLMLAARWLTIRDRPYQGHIPAWLIRDHTCTADD